MSVLGAFINTSVKSNLKTALTAITTIQSVVGNENAGLTKDVTDIQVDLTDINLSIEELQERDYIIVTDTLVEFPLVGDSKKLYIEKTENTIYRWDETDEEYIKLSEAIAAETTIVEVENNSELPSVGDAGKIYVDKSTDRVYRWDSSSSEYKSLATDIYPAVVVEEDTMGDFEVIGEVGRIYVDKSDNAIYRWDSIMEEYVPLAMDVAPPFPTIVVEKASFAEFEAGESGKIYVDMSENKMYRWNGFAYIPFEALGSVVEHIDREAFPEFGILNKIYINKSNNKIYKWDAINLQYVTLAEDIPVSQIIESDNFELFPTIGEIGKLYIDKSKNEIYRWEDKYMKIIDSNIIENVTLTSDILSSLDIVEAKGFDKSQIVWNPSINKYVACDYTSVDLYVYQTAMSSDGIYWEYYKTNIPLIGLLSMVWNPFLNMYIAVCFNDTSIYRSSDAITWNKTDIGRNMLSSTYTNTYHIVIGHGGNSISVDGINWEFTSMAGVFKSIAWSVSLSLFVAIGYDDNTIFTSSDTITWNSVSTFTSDYRWNDVVWNEALGIFIISIKTPTSQFITSPDGTNWTTQSFALPNEIVSLINIGTGFAAIGEDGVLYKSVDGITWENNEQYITPGKLTYSPSLDTIIVANRQFNMADNTLTLYEVKNTYFKKVVYSEIMQKYIAITNNDLYMSSDGITWGHKYYDGTSITDFVTHNTTIIIINTSYQYNISIDEGLTWNTVDFPSSTWFVSIYGNEKYVVLGNQKLVYSVNGIDWTEVSLSMIPSFAWDNIMWDGTRYIIHCDTNLFAISSDCISWDLVTSNGLESPYGNLIWVPRLSMYFIIYDSSSNVYSYSTDCISWTNVYGNYEQMKLVFGKDILMRFDNTGVSISYNGINFTNMSEYSTIYDVRYISEKDGKIIAVRDKDITYMITQNYTESTNTHYEFKSFEMTNTIKVDKESKVVEVLGDYKQGNLSILNEMSGFVALDNVSTPDAIVKCSTGGIAFVSGTTTIAELSASGEFKTLVPLFGDSVEYVVEAEDLAAFATTGVSNTIYVAKDTNIVYRWNGSAYIPLTAEAEVVVIEKADFASFDPVGLAGKIYVDKTDNKLYRWDSVAVEYVSLAEDVSSSDIIEGDNLAAFPVVGEVGKIYISKETNIMYRWAETEYVSLTAEPVEIIPVVIEKVNLAAFDVEGVSGTIYIDQENDEMYRWDGASYVKLVDTDVTILKGEVGILRDDADVLRDDVDGLITVVGDELSGLVKDVTTLETVVGDGASGLVKDVDDLQEVVGSESSGLVKLTADLESRIQAFDLLYSSLVDATKLFVNKRIDDQLTGAVEFIVDGALDPAVNILSVYKMEDSQDNTSGILLAFTTSGNVYRHDGSSWSLVDTYLNTMVDMTKLNDKVAVISTTDVQLVDKTGVTPLICSQANVLGVVTNGTTFAYITSDATNSNILTNTTFTDTPVAYTKSDSTALSHIMYSPYQRVAVAVASDGLSVFTSDAVLATWTKNACGTSSSTIVGACWNPSINMFFILKADNEILYSEDGITWEVDAIDVPSTPSQFGWCDNLKMMYYTYTLGGTSYIYISGDGLTWSLLFSSSNELSRVYDGVGGGILITTLNKSSLQRIDKKPWGIADMFSELEFRIRRLGV